MAFLGKEYKFVKQENYDAFLKATGIPDALLPTFLDAKPVVKVEKSGNTYTYTSSSKNGTRETKFIPGEEVEDILEGKIPAKATFTIDGNVLTQTVKTDDGTATFVREFNGDDLVTTFTASVFDGVAKRYYKA